MCWFRRLIPDTYVLMLLAGVFPGSSSRLVLMHTLIYCAMRVAVVVAMTQMAYLRIATLATDGSSLCMVTDRWLRMDD